MIDHENSADSDHYAIVRINVFLFDEGGGGGYKSREEISSFGLNTNDEGGGGGYKSSEEIQVFFV